jgi:predicted ester cyclase
VDRLIYTMRRFAVDFFSAHNPDVCAEIMAPDYVLTVGRHVISGRDDDYVPAVERQLEQFPGLTMTVHDLVVAPGRAALRFSEHGASGGPGGPVASWTGVALYHFDGQRLTHCFAAEDYLARRRQMKAGESDDVGPPAAAPWDVSVAGADPDAEEAVRTWLGLPHSASDPIVEFDDEHRTGSTLLQFEVTSAELLDLFSAGDRVAYAVVHRGTYLGGFEGTSPTHDVELFSAGVVRVAGGGVVSGHAVRDRLALLRAVSAQRA